MHALYIRRGDSVGKKNKQNKQTICYVRQMVNLEAVQVESDETETRQSILFNDDFCFCSYCELPAQAQW